MCENKLSSSFVVKIGIVVNDIEQTAERYNRLFALGKEAAVRYPDPNKKPAEGAYKRYHGEEVHPKLKSCIVDLSPVYLEILEPADEEKSPWRTYLETYGPGVCFLSFYIDGFEQHIDLMEKGGYPMSFVEEKMFERYAYFDTQEQLGVTIELKERKSR